MKNEILNKLKKLAKFHKWKFEETTSGHYQFFAPNGKDIVLVGPKVINNVTKSRIFGYFRKAGMPI